MKEAIGLDEVQFGALQATLRALTSNVAT